MIQDILLIASLLTLNINGQTDCNSFASGRYLNCYFQKLTTNFADNSNNSCAYVSLGMLFSYLDTCYNDSIIPDNCTVDSISNAATNALALANFLNTSTNSCVSPGVYSTYTNFALSTKTTVDDFHAGLLLIGQGLNLYNQYPNSGYGTKIGDGLLIGQTYLSSQIGSNNYYSYYQAGSNRDTIVQFIKTQINNNRPVVVSGTPYDSFNNPYLASYGHSFVVFDYEDDNDNTILYAHTGWHNTFRIVSFVPNSNESSFDYPWLCEAYTFKPKNHSHSSNIVINNNTVCACKFDDSNEYHSHVYDLKICQMNQTFHRVYCYCGYSVQQLHSFMLINNHTVCEFCGYSI